MTKSNSIGIIVVVSYMVTTWSRNPNSNAHPKLNHDPSNDKNTSNYAKEKTYITPSWES